MKLKERNDFILKQISMTASGSDKLWAYGLSSLRGKHWQEVRHEVHTCGKW